MFQNDIDTMERNKIGKVSGIVGIICNLGLSAGKIIVGKMAMSTSIVADGLNNLSDAASSIVTLLGFKFAEKPADRKHPYGHARYEYLAGLTVAMLILIIGYELAKSSVKKIMDPVSIEFSPVMLGVLVASILTKFFMMIYNLKMGKKIDSKMLLAAAADSRNDVIATSAVLMATLVEHFADVKVDGVMGLLVSLFVLYSGFSIAKDAISPLLGEAVDDELKSEMTEYIESCPMVIGCHDLMVHDYGPGKRYASIHVEMDESINSSLCHEMIDKVERECLCRFGVHMVIHFDPVVLNDPVTDRLKNLVLTILKIKDDRLEIHDFRVMLDCQPVRLSFDITLPEELDGQEWQITKTLQQGLKRLDGNQYELDVTFDL